MSYELCDTCCTLLSDGRCYCDLVEPRNTGREIPPMTQNNLTPEPLADAVAKVLELDATRDDTCDNLVPSDIRVTQGIIRQLWAEREQQRAAMVQAREALSEGKHYSCLSEAYQDESNFPVLADEALAALDAALGGV